MLNHERFEGRDLTNPRSSYARPEKVDQSEHRMGLYPNEKNEVDRLVWAIQRVKMEQYGGNGLLDYGDKQQLQAKLTRLVEEIGSRGESYLAQLLRDDKIAEHDFNSPVEFLDMADEPYSAHLDRLMASDGFRMYLDEEKRCKLANHIADQVASGVPTALPAARLHLYIALFHRPCGTKEDNVMTALKICHRLMMREARYAEPDIPLPTMGVEIEIPDRVFRSEHREVLNLLAIPNYRATEELNEMNPDFSYSPWVQARLLQDMAAWGAIPLTPHISPSMRPEISPDEPLSLHINFGSPVAMDKYRDGVEEGVYAINDLLTWAFVSPQRLQKRKTNESAKFKEDAEPHLKTNVQTKRLRIELRAGEFRDFSTYRLLAESQCLMGMFFAFQKCLQSQSDPRILISDKENILAKLWPFFTGEVLNMRKSFDLVSNAADVDVESLAHKIQNGELRQMSRRVVTKYARKIHSIAFSKPDNPSNAT